MEDVKPWEWDWSAISAVTAACIAAGVAGFGIWRSNRTANSSLRASYELKMLEFRHEWISKLRNEMVAYHSGLLTVAASGGQDFSMHDHRRNASHGKAIQLLMNPEDDDYDELIDLMTLMTNSQVPGRTLSLEDVSEVSDCFSKYTDISQRILKREWERLKSDKEEISNA